MKNPNPANPDPPVPAVGLIAPLVVIALYLPFIPRGFYGDDWFWLEWAQRSVQNPELFLSRPIYGYFRPLYMAYMAGLLKLFGFHAFLFGAANLLIHASNCYLLSVLLYRRGESRTVATTAALIFGCYFLYATSVCWISAGADILTVLLLLWLTFSLEALADDPSWGQWLRIIALCFAAIFTKETGLISIPLVFFFLILRRKNPLGSTHRMGSIVLVVLVAVYLAYYFATRTFVDKPIVLSWHALVNLWYLFVYQAIPISERLVALFPSSIETVLRAVRLIAIVAVPAAWVWALRRSKTIARYFLIWGIVALLPVAVLDWNLSLLDLYPERTASRFMYSAAPGLAVLFALVILPIVRRISSNRFLVPVLLLIFCTANAGVIYKVTQLYRVRQQADKVVFNSLIQHRVSLAECASVTLVVDSNLLQSTPFQSPEVLSSMSFLVDNRGIPVSVDAGYYLGSDTSKASVGNCRLYWDEALRQFGTR